MGHGPRRTAERLPAGDNPCCTCELGPKPHAIAGRDGNDTADRRTEALEMAMVERLPAATGP